MLIMVTDQDSPYALSSGTLITEKQVEAAHDLRKGLLYRIDASGKLGLVNGLTEKRDGMTVRSRPVSPECLQGFVYKSNSLRAGQVDVGLG